MRVGIDSYSYHRLLGEMRRGEPPPPRLLTTPHPDLQAMRDAADRRLTSYGWVDRNARVVHIPIERAMELVLQEWRNPAAARSNLDARADKFFPPPPPPAAPKPSEFE